MGIMFTESFQRFARGTFGSGSVTATNMLRPIQTDSEWSERAWTTGGNLTVNGTYAVADSYGMVGIIQDPIVAVKNRLSMDANLTPAGGTNYNPNNQMGYALARTFPAAKTKYQVGFLARFRGGAYLTAARGQAYAFEFTPVMAKVTASSNLQFRYAYVGSTSAANQLASIFGADNLGVPGTTWANMTTVAASLDVPPVLRINGVVDPNASQIKLQYDTDHFFEIEVDITNQTLKIWVDDIYAGLATWSATYGPQLANGFQIHMIRASTGSGASNQDYGGVMISDIYCLDMSDGQTPNTRLGKTTRVMGEAPDTDISTMFTRPAGFNGNYDVINDPIVDNTVPANYLTGDGAGTEDVYQTATSNINLFAGTVHGVVLRARYQNASATTHELAITSDDGTTKKVSSLGNVAASTGLIMKSVVLNKDPSGNAWTAAKAASLKYGFKIVS